MVYPSSLQVSYCFDAAGRAKNVIKGSPGDAARYADQVSYYGHGGLKSMRTALAGAKYENYTETSWEYSPRLYPTKILAMRGGTRLLELNYTYAENGNVLTQAIGRGTTSWQQGPFGYDGLNRLKTANETNGWAHTYVYDRYGNRAVLATSTPAPDGIFTPSVQHDWPSEVEAVYTAKNQWVGAQHNANTGEMESYPVGVPEVNKRRLQYDAEHRVISATIPNIGAIGYDYDAEGRRVRKVVGAERTVYVYDAFGNLAAEYGGSSPATGPLYATTDTLGSIRLLTDANGVEVRRYDYYPFGQDIARGVNGRGDLYPTGNAPDVADVEPLKFTGKPRDAETGLDYFGARYYSAAQGRFTSPDEWQGGIVDAFTGQDVEQPGPLPYADITDPQTLNKYAYVRNNPLRYVDPDGHCPWCIGGLVGGGMDIGIQLLEGKSFSNLDWTSVGISAAAGAVGGGIAAKTAQLAWWGKLAIEGSLDAAASMAQQGHKNGTVSPTETAIDVVAGRVVGGVVSSVVEKAAANSSTVKQLLKEADRKTRIANGAEAAGNASSAARRNAQAGALKSEANSIVYGRAAGASTAASQAASEAAKKAAERARKKKEEQP